MTYVETMALRAWNECHGIHRCEGTIEQVIADTKRVCLEALEYNIPFEPIPLWRCKQIIWQAQPRAEGEV